jgi:adenylate cyclase
VGAITSVSLFREYEKKLYDVKTRVFSRTVPSDIVLVEIDQSSLDFYRKNFDLSFPWPRSLYARAVDFMAESGARAIALDMIFSEPDPYGSEDQKLSASMAKAGNVFLPVFFNLDESSAVPLPRFSLDQKTGLRPLPRKGVLVSVPPILQSQRGGGNSKAEPDRDGIFRGLNHLFLYQGRVFPSFPLSLALFLNRKTELKQVPFAKDGSLNLVFYRKESFRRLRISDVIQSQVRVAEGQQPVVSRTEFKGKIVIVGATAPGLLDLRPTPLNGSGGGFEIAATALLNFHRRDFRVNFPIAAQWGVLLLIVLLLNGMLFKTKSYWTQGVVSLSFFVGAVAANFLGFRFGVNLNLLPQILAIVGTSSYDVYHRYYQVRREKKFIQGAFRNYLSDSLLKQILKNPEGLALGGEKKVLTIFFSDLAGFTSFSEQLNAEDVVSILNAYLERMTTIIMDHDGFVNKFEGDAIMAFWGAPIPIADQTGKAMRAALECQRDLVELNREFRGRGHPDLGMRIGINSGEVIVGNIGSRKRFEYTVIGDAVNIASRLEGINKRYGTRIICGAATRELDSGDLVLRKLDRVRVKGKTRPEEIFEVVGLRGEAGKDVRERIARYEEALAFYFAGDFQRAASLFSEILEDPPSQVFAKRCQFLLEHPPADWDGVITYTEK